MTIDDYLKMPTNKSALPSKRYGGFLKYHHDKINTSNISNVMNYIRNSGLSDGSQATLTQGLCKYFIEAETFKSKDIRHLRAAFPHEQKAWSEKQIDISTVEKLLQNIQTNSISDYYKDRNTAIVVFLASFGMRAEQLLNLKTNDIILNHNAHLITLNLIRQKHRNMYGRTEYFSIVLNYDAMFCGVSIYETYIKQMRHLKDDSYFICSKRGEKISYERLRIIFSELSKDIGIKLTAHSLRHFVASVTTEKYGLAVANALLNHSRLETTRKYVNKTSLLETTFGAK